MTLETLLFSLIALTLALGTLYLLFPTITQLLDGDLRFGMLLNTNVMILAGAGLVVLLFFSTYFPAKMFTTTGVIQNLKSKNSGYNSSVSRILLLAQFSISAICISCAVMVGKQINFIHNKDLGFDKRNLLMLNMPGEFTVIRYHSLAIERATLPECLHISAETEDGEIMGVRHKGSLTDANFAPLEGVQFHPESILTEHGHAMLKNFLVR